MTDVLKQAKALIRQHNESGFIHRDATMLLPELVAECERLRNAAPAMLAALGQIREGDANSIRFIIGQIETAIVNAKMDPNVAEYLPTIKRMLEMCRMMEAPE